MSTNRRLSGRQALAAWPERLAAVRTEPSDEGLQRLCSLLDAIDRWVVERWDAPGHSDRLASLTGCRHEARQAAALVSATLRDAKATRAAKGGAARRPNEGPPSGSERLVGPLTGDHTGPGSAAA